MILNTENEVLIPQYMNNFKCIGSLCEDTCCSGWKVTIDEKTYQKYRKSKHVELKPMFKKFIKRQRSQSSSANFAKIQMTENNACSFLTSEKLCGIQIELGESYLSDTCSTYPRIVNAVDRVIEKSATISCPEVARLVLLNSNGIQFNQFKDDSINGKISRSIFTNESKNKLKQYFWSLRIFTIQLIQNRNYSIENRIIICGLFFKKIQELIDNNKYENISNTIETFNEMINNNDFDNTIEKIPYKSILNLKLCQEIVSGKFNKGIPNKRYAECLSEMLHGLSEVNKNDDEMFDIVKYRQIYNDFYSPFMKKHEYILENYLVNYIFKNLYPVQYKKPFEDFIMLVVHYSLIKLHLTGMSGYHRGLTEELVVKLIQSFAKSMEHDPIYLYNVLEFLKNNNCDNMAYMSIFIKG